MTRLTFISITFLCLTSCNRSKKADCNFIKKEFYPTGKIRDILSLNSDSIKNGECFYFSEYGFLDSSVTFSNGILQGLKRIFYNDETDTYNYIDDSLISHSVYDSSNVLKYVTPLDIKTIGKTEIKFFSNRNYLTQNKLDTLSISNAGLPYANREMMVAGARITFLSDTIFSLSANTDAKKKNRIIIKVFARQNIGEPNENIIPIDSTIILVK